MGCRFLMLLAFPWVFTFLAVEENAPVSGEFRLYGAIGFRLVRKP